MVPRYLFLYKEFKEKFDTPARRKGSVRDCGRLGTTADRTSSVLESLREGATQGSAGAGSPTMGDHPEGLSTVTGGGEQTVSEEGGADLLEGSPECLMETEDPEGQIRKCPP